MAAGMQDNTEVTPTATPAPKSIVQSKTAWGAVAMLISLLLQRQHVAIPDDADQLASQIIDGLQQLSSAIGFILVIWGRITAKRPIKFPG